mgnify:CR=1 FL=1
MSVRLQSIHAVDSARRRTAIVLTGILLVGGLVRLAGLTRVPPGINPDEAANAWNAYCLLKTGQDQWGQRWPIFCMRAMGEYRSTLFAYALLPFQGVGGLDEYTTRLPAALGGLLTIVVLYALVARLFGPGTALLAAGLLAVNPTHIQMSRWGHEAALTPLLTALPVLAALWAGLPFDDADRPARLRRAIVAGLVAGAACYGYPAVRLFLPLFLGCGAVIAIGSYWRCLQIRGQALAVGAYVAAFTFTFAPLLYEHIRAPDTIGRRGRTTWLWSAADPAAARFAKVLDRYAAHFGPDFLFRHGDADEVAWTAGVGFLPWYALPLMLVGLLVSLRRAHRSRAARVLLVGVLLYPAGDCLNWHISLHGLRSSAGLWALITLAAVGTSDLFERLRRTGHWGWTVSAAVALGAAVALESVSFGRTYFGERPRQIAVYHGNAADLLAACKWLRPRLERYDAIICTTTDLNQPYLTLLVGLAHDPRCWFSEPRQWQHAGNWDQCTRYGKFHFPRADQRATVLDELRAAGQAQRVLLLLRPGEASPGRVIKRFFSPDGHPALIVRELTL